MNLYNFKISIPYEGKMLTCYLIIECSSSLYNQIQELLIYKLTSNYKFVPVLNENPICIGINTVEDKRAYYNSELFSDYLTFPGTIRFTDENHRLIPHIIHSKLIYNTDLTSTEIEHYLPFQMEIDVSKDYFRSLKID